MLDENQAAGGKGLTSEDPHQPGQSEQTLPGERDLE